jgi:hypothetical protein
VDRDRDARARRPGLVILLLQHGGPAASAPTALPLDLLLSWAGGHRHPALLFTAARQAPALFDPRLPPIYRAVAAVPARRAGLRRAADHRSPVCFGAILDRACDLHPRRLAARTERGTAAPL